MRTLWSIAVMIAVAEIVFYLCFHKTVLAGRDPIEYMRNFALIPTIVNVIVLGTAELLFAKSRATPLQRNAFPLAAATLMALQMAIVHANVAILAMVFAYPVAFSLAYADRRLLFFAFAINFIDYLGYALIYMPYFSHLTLPPNYQMEVLTTIIMLLGEIVMAYAVMARITELGMKNAQADMRKQMLEQLVKLDSFTKLYNHAAFYEALDTQILAHQKTGVTFSLILMDLDDFKLINDKHGHEMGDRVIMTLVGSIRQCLSPTDTPYRYGGEEFVIITMADEAEAMRLSERVRLDFQNRVVPDTGLTCTVSMGVCTYKETYTGRREFFSAVDQALYDAKHAGKNQTRIARPEQPVTPPAAT